MLNYLVQKVPPEGGGACLCPHPPLKVQILHLALWAKAGGKLRLQISRP